METTINTLMFKDETVIVTENAEIIECADKEECQMVIAWHS